MKFTDAELLGMPWILTVSPRSLAAGGIEVTERATGERATRPIEEVERLLVEGFSTAYVVRALDRRVGGIAPSAAGIAAAST